mgnify:CR=1
MVMALRLRSRASDSHRICVISLRQGTLAMPWRGPAEQHVCAPGIRRRPPGALSIQQVAILVFARRSTHKRIKQAGAKDGRHSGERPRLRRPSSRPWVLAAGSWLHRVCGIVQC